VGLCRGDEAKEVLVRDYWINPLAHLYLLGKQVKRCCCGDLLSKEYYLMICVKKSDKNIRKPIYVGGTCAGKLFNLSGAPTHMYFNPFATVGNETTSRTSGGHEGDIKIEPLNKEIREAIFLLCMDWDQPPGIPTSNILAMINRAPSRRLADHYVKAVNTIIGKDSRRRKLQDIIEGLRVIEKRIRHFRFPEMKAVINSIGLSDNIG
jgi:hypothetical protein